MPKPVVKTKTEVTQSSLMGHARDSGYAVSSPPVQPSGRLNFAFRIKSPCPYDRIRVTYNGGVASISNGGNTLRVREPVAENFLEVVEQVHKLSYQESNGEPTQAMVRWMDQLSDLWEDDADSMKDEFQRGIAQLDANDLAHVKKLLSSWADDLEAEAEAFRAIAASI